MQDQDYLELPWVAVRVTGTPPRELETGELDLERIAALDPDLIVGVSAGMSEEEYGLLSQIAPTIVQPPGIVDFDAPWDLQLRVIAEALGRDDQMDDLVAGVEEALAEARKANPDCAGARALWASLMDPAGDFSVFGADDQRATVVVDLGFELPDVVDELVDGEFFGRFSRERVELLDEADVLVWIAPGTEDVIREDPLYRQLDVATEGRDVFWSRWSGPRCPTERC